MPTPANVHLYRAAALAYRAAWRIERVKEKLADRHAPLHAAALAVKQAAPGMKLAEAAAFAQRAVAWAAQMHNAWFWGE